MTHDDAGDPSADDLFTPTERTPTDILAFWRDARAVVSDIPESPPAADRVWAFGATPEQADRLLELVLRGEKTATTGFMVEYEAEGADVEQVGDLDVLLDGAGVPRAIIETTQVDVVAFAQVTAAHAFAEGEADRTLEAWRRDHRNFYTQHVAREVGFSDELPVICQRFRVRYPVTGVRLDA